MAEVNDDRLRLLIERVERLEEEKKGTGDDIKDVYLEAKAVGYDVKIMRQIVRLRKMAPDDRKEMEAILDLYKSALGMGFDSTPLGAASLKEEVKAAIENFEQVTDGVAVTMSVDGGDFVPLNKAARAAAH